MWFVTALAQKLSIALFEKTAIFRLLWVGPEIELESNYNKNISGVFYERRPIAEHYEHLQAHFNSPVQSFYIVW